MHAYQSGELLLDSTIWRRTCRSCVRQTLKPRSMECVEDFVRGKQEDFVVNAAKEDRLSVRRE